MADYTLSAKITGDSSGLERAFASAQKQLDVFSKNFEGISQKLEGMSKSFAPISAAVAGVGIASGKMALNFEDSMANVNTLLDDPSHLEGYENAVKRISNNTGLSLDTMSQGMYQAISSLGDGGVETEKIFNTMAISAKAGGAEVSDSVALISAGMKGYNDISNETAQKLSDLAFMTAKLGVTTFPEMAKSMQPLFPLANSLNLSYEELFGSMATLTGVTGNTAEVSTQLKAVFSNLMSPTTAMQGVIEKYGYSSGQAMLESEGLAGMLKIVQQETGGQADKMAELFSSTEAVTAMTALTGSQFDTFNEKLAAMSDVTGTTSEAYEKLKTNGDKLRIAWNQIKIAGVGLGSTMIDMLAPSIEKLGDQISICSEWFLNAEDSTKRFIVIAMGIVAAIAPALAVMSKVAGVMPTLASGFGFLISPIGLVIAAIGGLTAVFVHLYHTNDSVSNGIKTAWASTSSTIAGIVNGIKPVFSGIFDGAVQSIKNFTPTFSIIFSTLGQVVGVLKNIFSGFFSGLSSGFIGGLSGAAGFQTGFMTILGMISPPLKMILLLFQNFGPQIQSLVSIIGSSLVPVFSTLGNTIGGVASAVIPAIQSAIANLLPVIMQVVNVVLQIITTVLPVLVSLITQLAPFLVQMVSVIGQLASALMPIIAQLVGTLLPVISNIITVIMNVITAVMPALIGILNVVMAVIQTLVPIISNILSIVISVIDGVISTVSPIISFIGMVIAAIMAIISPIVTFVSGIIATIIQIVGTVIGAVSSVFSTVFAIVSGTWSNISDFIATIITAVSTVISGLTGIVGDVFNTIYQTVSSVMGNVRSFITGVFDGIQAAWNGLTGFVSGVFDGIGSAVQELVSQVKGFVNGVIGGINAAVGLINKIPGVSIGTIPYLLHGTDDWSGGFARMNEGGRGELTYLPNGTQVIPHDVSMKYAKESARNNSGEGTLQIDYNYLIEGIANAMGNVKVQHVSTLNGKVLINEITPLFDKKMGARKQMKERYAN